MSTTDLEVRITALERKIAQLAGKVDDSTSKDINSWIDEIHGTFPDNAMYRQSARLGRQWRKLRKSDGSGSRKSSAK